MIGRLTGKVVEDAGDGVVVVDVGGVGYEVVVPLGALGRATPDATGAVTLWVHTHVREDAFQLFGFPSREDRAAFRALIGISNVGPKIAVAVLGALGVDELALAVSRGEPSRLVAVPGVGKKTAERLVLELKDKLAPPVRRPATPATAPRPVVETDKQTLLLGALTRMGFRPAEAERAVATLPAGQVEEEPLDKLVKSALALLR